MDQIKRGMIFYYKRSDDETGSEQHGGRPAIIVSNDMCNENSPTVTIVPLTTAPKSNLPTHCTIRSTGRVSTALCENVQTISTFRVGDMAEGRCTPEEMRQVDNCLMIQLGLNPEPVRPQAPAPQLTATAAFPKQKTTEPVPDRISYELAKVEGERDTYKRLFEDLIARIVK